VSASDTSGEVVLDFASAAAAGAAERSHANERAARTTGAVSFLIVVFIKTSFGL